MNSSSLSYWGLLGPENTGSIRRTRTLELGAVVRKFNNLAVPGMGNVWYAKQIYLASLGLAVAEKARKENQKVKNIETANAIEAIACFLSFENNGWQKDPRLKGSNKLKDISDISFAKVRKPGFYITQPMRMGIVQTLPALGIVHADSIRFNSFQLTEDGHTLVNRISTEYPELLRGKNIIDYLILWIKDAVHESSFRNNEKLQKLLSPGVMLNTSNRVMIEKFILNQHNRFAANRCSGILLWMDMDYLLKKGHLSWNNKPACLDDAHWLDLKTGALFFKTRKVALDLLDKLEVNISHKNSNKISLSQANKELAKAQLDLQKAAYDFIALKYDPSPGKEATRFCEACVDEENCIRSLVQRDGAGLKLNGEMVLPGPAFKGKELAVYDIQEDDEQALPDTDYIKLPEYISPRVKNMFYLNQDLKGKLNQWL